VLARLLSISRGIKVLTPDVWTDVKNMEKERKARLHEQGSAPAAS